MTINDDLYEFWFGDGAGPRAEWFKKNDAFDREIAEKFSHRLATSVGLRPRTPRERLNLILLFDQVPRNAFRGDARSFSFDSRALALTKEGLAAGELEQLNVLEALFFLLPLEHSESIEDQRECVERMRRLVERAPADLEKFAREIHEFAIKHERIIARFGRFPHRNQIVDRASTPEEVEFLKEPGSRF